ncbi:dihydrolipoyllysine-residue acetyltransferase component of pyruvate dehydrogenase complex [mine drainage metagenome]|uniref:dihydrolipoyllysine-residue acetyltransferase n=1 Tax=mine drainage metagenome TaxID=410659 RepID=A0A1J5TI86_9ZZZZ
MAQIIDMPKLSDTMTVGTLVKWKKKEGDAVKSGDMLAEVETDKATMELESFFDGTLVKIFASEGSQVAIGAALCAIGKPGETVEAPATAPKPAPAAAAPAPAAAPAHEPAPVAQPAAPAAPAQPAPVAPAGRVKISPLARKIAQEKGIDFRLIQGSGPGGRIVRADVLAAEKSGVSAPKSSGALLSSGSSVARGPIQVERVAPVSNMRGTIARRLVESKTQLPHFYLEIEVDAGPVVDLRKQLNTALEGEGVKLSVNDFILKASAEALRQVPAVNASWEGTQIRYHGGAHVSMAVAIEDGLITPVIRDAHAKSLFQISTEAKQLAKLAKDKKLQPAQFTGGTFCVSNLGMMGITRFNAIINPPNAAILAVGTTVEKPVVKDGAIVVGQRMSLTLSCDHRVVDGAIGAQYLGALKRLIESPALLLL